MKAIYMVRYFFKTIIPVAVLFCLTAGCKKLTVADPSLASLTQTNVFTSDGTAISVLTGIYSNMSTNSFATGNGSITDYAGLSADELSLWSGQSNSTLIGFYQNNLGAGGANNIGSDFWSPLYRFIYQANSAIDALNSASSNALTPSVKKQLMGEAKFLRAFYYFYLVNMYGDVPLITTLDYPTTARLPRTPKANVYEQIISDLKDAQTLLSNIYLNGNLVSYAGTQERVRPTSWAATALLARVYLYTGNYAGANDQATVVINNAAQFGLTSLNTVFLKNSPETIWQLQPVGFGPIINTLDGYFFIIPSTGFSNNQTYYVNDTLVTRFEPNDNRKTNWMKTYTSGTRTFYYPYKYQQNATSGNQSEYLMVLRLAEQYLIRAEASAQQGNISGAQADLNAIRTRAGLPNTTASTQSALLAAIMHERQVELFTEWGHRWFDLKRTGTIDQVMSIQTPAKGGQSWSSYKQLFPILNSDITADQNLVQNPGY